jgi:hypothetical protein
METEDSKTPIFFTMGHKSALGGDRQSSVFENLQSMGEEQIL